MSSDEDVDLQLDELLQSIAEKEINEPSNIDAKRVQIAELRRRIFLQSNAANRIRDTGTKSLIRFLRSSKFNIDKALSKTIEYERFYTNNKLSLEGIVPSTEFPPFRDLVHVHRDLLLDQGRQVIVCLFPKMALPNITHEMIQSNPRILMRFNIWLLERLSYDHQIQVCGLVLLNSFCETGLPISVTLQQLASLAERRAVLGFFNILNFRLKAACVFEEPAFLSWLWFILKRFMSFKIQSRFHLCGRDYSRVDIAVGPGVREHLGEPYISSGSQKFNPAPIPINESWVMKHVAASASTRMYG